MWPYAIIDVIISVVLSSRIPSGQVWAQRLSLNPPPVQGEIGRRDKIRLQLVGKECPVSNPAEFHLKQENTRF